MHQAAKEYHWNLNYGAMALMWRGGCIIRSRFLGKIKEAFDNNPQLTKPAARQFLYRRDCQGAAERVATRRRSRCRAGHSRPLLQHRPRLL